MLKTLKKFFAFCGDVYKRQHYIRKNVLLDLVLEDMRRVLQYVKEHEQDFICKATEYGDMEARKALAQQQKELSKAQARMTELFINPGVGFLVQLIYLFCCIFYIMFDE